MRVISAPSSGSLEVPTDTPTQEFPLTWSRDLEAKDLVPNSFDETFGALVPIARDEPWETLLPRIQAHMPRQVLGLFPAFLQLGSRFHSAMRSLSRSALSLAEEQYRSAAALVSTLEIDGVVLREETLAPFLQALRDASPLSKPYIQVVMPPSAASLHAERAVYREVHIVPGVAALYQCEALSLTPNGFHPSERFLWEEDTESLFVSDSEARFARARWSRKATVRTDSCACGRTCTILLR